MKMMFSNRCLVLVAFFFSCIAQTFAIDVFFGLKDETAITAGDEVQIGWFTDRGYNVELWDNTKINVDKAATLAAANAADLVYTSESISSGRFRTLESTSTPMILSEQFAADLLGFFRENGGSEFDDAHGSPTAQNADGFNIIAGSSFGTSITIVDDTHPIALGAGLSNGDHAVYGGSGGRLSWVDVMVGDPDLPVGSADVIALLADYDDTHPTAAALFVVEAGKPIDEFNMAQVPPGPDELIKNAPGMRIFNFLSDTNRGPEDNVLIAGGTMESDGSGPGWEATLLTDAGTALMMASIDYALGITTTPGTDGDFDDDGDYDGADIDALVFEIAAGTNGMSFDLNGDGEVNLADRDAWLVEGGAAELASGNPFPVGDQDLNGSVTSADLGLLLNNFGASSGVAYTGGDLNADSDVNSTDLGLLLNNFGVSVAASGVAVPEPNAMSLSLLGVMALACRGRSKRSNR